MYTCLKNKKILITGHTGFVGSWLCAVMSFLGLNITGFSLLEENNSLYGKIKEHLTITSVYGDLSNKNAVSSLVTSINPDIIFHIAAFGFVKECFDDPVRAYSSNVQGTLNLLEAIKTMEKPCKIILASSDKVYKNLDTNAYLFNESDSLGGTDPYSASKTCEDILAQSHFNSYLSSKNCAMCIIRPSNILGGGDHNMNRLIPNIYHSLKLGKKPEIRNPNSIRPWQNIFDIIDAYLTVAEKINTGCHIYNVGPEQEGIKTVGEIASYVSNLYGTNFIQENQSELEVKEKTYLGLSIDKIKKELNWKPKRTLEQTLDEIYDFYNHDNGKNTYEICLSQINKYYD